MRMHATLKDNLAWLLPLIGGDRLIAEHLGVRVSSVCRWRNGTTVPKEAHIAALTILVGAPLVAGQLRYKDIRDDEALRKRLGALRRLLEAEDEVHQLQRPGNVSDAPPPAALSSAAVGGVEPPE